jgi:hypothetical protein
MENATKLILVIVGIGLLLGLLLSPFVTVLARVSLWILLWLGQGGAAEGNPYKRMNMRGTVPNWVTVNQYQKNQIIETRDAGSIYTAYFIFGTGAILMAIGFIWLWISGSI